MKTFPTAQTIALNRWLDHRTIIIMGISVFFLLNFGFLPIYFLAVSQMSYNVVELFFTHSVLFIDEQKSDLEKTEKRVQGYITESG